MHKLLQLRQTGSVAEYRREFDTHMYHLLALDATPESQVLHRTISSGIEGRVTRRCSVAIAYQHHTSFSPGSIQEGEGELHCPCH